MWDCGTVGTELRRQRLWSSSLSKSVRTTLLKGVTQCFIFLRVDLFHLCHQQLCHFLLFMLHLVPPQPVFVDGSKTPREYTVEIVVATGGLLTHVTTMGMGRVSMKTPERAQQPPTNFPGKIYILTIMAIMTIYLSIFCYYPGKIWGWARIPPWWWSSGSTRKTLQRSRRSRDG